MLNLLRSKIRAEKSLREPLRRILTTLTVHRKGELEDIIIFSCRRSGSTWLMELLSAAPRMRFVNEPFLASLVAQVGLPTTFENHLPLDQRKIIGVPEHAAEAYRHHLLNPRTTQIRSAYDLFSPQHHLFTNRRVIKIIHATAIADWIMGQGFGFTPLYLVRHPLATALSMTHSGMIVRSSSNLQHKEFRDRYLNGDLINLAESILERGTELEKFVLEWCLDNIVTYKTWQQSKWAFITYEELLLQPERSLAYLCETLKLSDAPRLIELAKVPSAATVPKRRSAVADNGRQQIARWRSFVDEAAEVRAFAITEAFGFDLYQVGEDTARKKYLHFLDK